MNLKWSDILKRDLYRFPPGGREFHTPNNLIITNSVKKKIKKEILLLEDIIVRVYISTKILL